MSRWLISLLSLVLVAAHAEEAWTWLDANGTRHYSDRPVDGATRIELGPAQGFTPSQPVPARASGPEPRAETPAAERYTVFDVVSPEQQETLWNIQGNLSVRVDLQPGLQPGHRVDVYVDGQRRNLNATSTQLVVPEVFRGMHSLQAVVVDADGNELARTQAVSFMVQQTSIVRPAG